MSEQPQLEKLGVIGEWLWGDDVENTVFAQAYGHNQTLIFRFTRDDAYGSRSLVNRIVSCYHGLESDGQESSFPNRQVMRRKLWSTVATVWEQCSMLAKVNDPDAIVDIYDVASSVGNEDQITWKVSHSPLFSALLDSFQPVSQPGLDSSLNTIDFNSLIRMDQPGGRGSTTLVCQISDPQTRYVFKGIDFRTFLNQYESGQIHEEVKNFYWSLKLIDGMPPYPNITTPPLALVTIQRTSDKSEVICGSLHTFFANGSLAAQLEESNQSEQRISLKNKAKWCYQMVAAIAHAHLTAHTYHMDIKPGNFLLNDDWNLVLIDWEQSDAPVSTIAPEADGSWDVEQLQEGFSARLVYTKYAGPDRRNMPESTPGQNGWNVWNVFPIWNKQCPKALELAEVFSLGRSMWMLLRQPDTSVFEDVTNTNEIEEDWSNSDDIPKSWRYIVDKCLERNPTERIGLHQLLVFWEELQHINIDA